MGEKNPNYRDHYAELSFLHYLSMGSQNYKKDHHDYLYNIHYQPHTFHP